MVEVCSFRTKAVVFVFVNFVFILDFSEAAVAENTGESTELASLSVSDNTEVSDIKTFILTVFLRTARNLCFVRVDLFHAILR